MSAMLIPTFQSVATPDIPGRHCATHASAKPTETVKKRSRTNLAKICQKTKMCSFFMRGACKRDTNCTFAHDPSEIQTKPDLSGTKMCPALLQTGHCLQISSCKFAHHEDELRSIDTETHDSPQVSCITGHKLSSSTVPSAVDKLPLLHLPVRKKKYTSPQVISSLRKAAVSDTLTLGEMVMHLTNIFASIYETRPQLVDCVGATASALASLTAEQAWADACLNKDSSMSFEDFASWCSLSSDGSASSVGVIISSASLTSDALQTRAKNELCCPASSVASTIDSDALSHCSTEDSDGTSSASMFAPSQSLSGLQTPGSYEHRQLKNLDRQPISVKNTFVHFQESDPSITHRRSRSVPCWNRRKVDGQS